MMEMALRSLGTNRLRTGLTVAIIAVGIMSLVGIQTALEIMTQKIVGSFSKMGAAAFTITSDGAHAPLSLRQAVRFKQAAAQEDAGTICISIVRNPIVQAKYGSVVTDPLVSLVEADENYLVCNSAAIADGRMFNLREIESKAAVALIGDNLCKKLFAGNNPLGKTITADGRHFVVVGRISRQGSMLGSGLDNNIVTPLGGEGDYCLTVVPPPNVELAQAVSGARSLMRAVRRLPAAAPDDFVISRADSLQDNLASLKTKLSLAALVIGLITLLGSSAGLMNIMLVSVKERTCEIGIRKALGARRAGISRQFLAEAVTIGQIGGAAGIILGILFGNIVAIVMEGRFTILWDWVALSILICFAVSILSGVVPARRAAALPPIAALRNE